MFSNIIFVLATVCVINASVITVNVYDDNPETEVAVNPKSCNYQACDQLCRRLKFPGGACVNGRCKCDNFRNAEDAVAEKSLSDLEDLVSLKDDYEPEVAAIPKKCNLRACEQLCRRLKFPGGTCVNGRCKCDNFLNAEDGVSKESVYDLEDSVLQKGDLDTEFARKSSKCHWKLCNLLCHLLNNTRGACVDGRCKCADKIKVSEESLSDPEESVSPRGCINQGCIDLCRKLKLHGGTCSGGRCVCKVSLLEVSEESLSDPEESVSPRGCITQGCIDLCRKLKLHGGTCSGGRCVCKVSLLEDAVIDTTEFVSLRDCNYGACDQMCRRLGFPGGACVNGRCKCDNFLSTEGAVSETLSNLQDSDSLRKCTHQACNDLCRKLKFREGVCIAGRCRCNNYFPNPQAAMTDSVESFPSTEDEISENLVPVSELSEDLTERSCNMRACEQLCRRLKFPGGACVNGRCKCDNFFTKEDADAVDEYSELAPRRVCRLNKCNRTCTRRGYEFARCVNGRCECYNKQTDPSFLNEVTIDEQEVSNLVVLTNEEELIVPSTRACNTVNCNQMCHRLKYAGGWCRGGVCQCY